MAKSNSSEDLQELTRSLKTILEENDGEFPYWGETISLQALPKELLAKESSLGFKNVSPIEKSHSSPTMKPPAPTFSEPVRKEVVIPTAGTKAEKLAFLRDSVIGDCQLCPLSQTRIKLVFGVGNPDADVLFIGEGPGFDEDREGEPFVGKAGQYLDKIIGSIGLNRDNSYIANIVKCHPLKNPKRPEMRGNDRPPTPKEVDACDPFLKAQIKIIDPKIIVTLGSPAVKAILNTSDGITRLRGKITKKELIPGIPPFSILPTYHPSAVLRNEDLKRPVWEDMKTLRAFLQESQK